MSQHYFPTIYQGRSVTVVVGFDRPLRGFFCFVERNDAEEQEEEFVYSNLDDPKLFGSMGMARTLKHFEKRLADLGFVVPRSMFAEAEADQRFNVGNRCVWHDGKGVLHNAATDWCSGRTISNSKNRG